METEWYRKYRPRTFDEIRGNESTVSVLRREVMKKRPGTVSLFHGPSGTGKTTLARIIAKAFNCENPVDGNPCCNCEACRLIDAGSTDIVEMDAASNNGVEDARNLLEQVRYKPVSLRYKVFIIDEAHALSVAAQNSLMKTFEDGGGEHVIFVLCTTEPDKIIAPIRTRAAGHTNKLRSLDNDEMVNLLADIAEKEKVEFDLSAIYGIARYAKGGSRTGVATLQLCCNMAAQMGTKLTEEVVNTTLGLGNDVYLRSLITSLLNLDVKGAVATAGNLAMEGTSIISVANGAIELLLDILAASQCGTEEVLGTSSYKEWLETFTKIDDVAVKTEAYIDLMGKMKVSIGSDTNRESALKASMIRMVREVKQQMLFDYEALLKHIANLEKRVEELEIQVKNGVKEASSPAKEEPVPEVKNQKDEGEDKGGEKIPVETKQERPSQEFSVPTLEGTVEDAYSDYTGPESDELSGGLTLDQILSGMHQEDSHVPEIHQDERIQEEEGREATNEELDFFNTLFSQKGRA